MFQPYSSTADTQKFQFNLPHWRQRGVTYFVTTRLKDSMPQSLLRSWENERGNWFRAVGFQSSTSIGDLPEALRKEYDRRFTVKWHEILDAGEGECLLADSENAKLVGAALHHFHGLRYVLGDFVVMPNHLHVLVTPLPGWDLSEILRSWKGFTARAINKRMKRTGSLWQHESFDHIVRSLEQFERFRRYVAENPTKARLKAGQFFHFRAES